MFYSSKINLSEISLLKNVELKEVKEVGGGTFCVNCEFMVKVKKSVIDMRVGLNLDFIREKLNVAEFGEETIDDGQMNVCVQKYFKNLRQISGSFLLEVGRIRCLS